MTDANGLCYMRARYYNPEIRRFVNQDVLIGNIDDTQSLNRFGYVKGNPVTRIDPQGKFAFAIPIAVAEAPTVAAATAALTTAAVAATAELYSEVKNRYLTKDEGKTSKHSTSTSKSLPTHGAPNSSVDRVDKKGNVIQRRFYDKNGRATKDIDFTDHGNPKKHPKVPHEHRWDWTKKDPRCPEN